MQESDLPPRFTYPFANAAGVGYIDVVPVTSQIGITDGAASFHDGFPPDCFLPTVSGGVPPFGQDFNGILNVITKWIWFLQAGQSVVYNASFQTTIGGYPAGAVLRKLDNSAFFVSLVDNNTSNPETGGANWGVVGTSTVFGRTGHVIAEPGDYRLDMLTANEELVAAAGYQNLAGGLIQQWAEHFVPASTGAAGDITITYFYPFPSLVMIPRVTVFDANMGQGLLGTIHDANQVIVGVSSYNRSSCVVHYGTNGGGARDFTICLDVRGY